jgi:hypothetical protein
MRAEDSLAHTASSLGTADPHLDSLEFSPGHMQPPLAHLWGGTPLGSLQL